MTIEEKVALVKVLSDETDDDVISVSLNLAGEVLYHYGDPGRTMELSDFLDMYGSTQAKAAAYYLNKRGWDFQTAHSENGISRSFEAGDLPDSILREITTICW